MYAYGMSGYAAYQRTDVLSLAPVEIVSRLFTALARSVEEAGEAMMQGMTARKGEKIGKAVSILGELRGSLNREEGGEIAENLDRLYEHLLWQITRANVENDPARLELAGRVLGPLVDAWAELAEKERGHKGMPPGDGPSAETGRHVQIAL